MRLALLQTPPHEDEAAATRTLTQALMAAGAAGAATLVAAELFFPGYNRDDIPSRAEPRGGPLHQRLSQTAARAGCGLVVGYAERDGDRLFNSAVAFDATGREAAHYRKIQLYGPREKALFTPGDAFVTFDLHGTKAAILICYDVEFAAHIAALATMGVKVILVPTANMMPYTHVAEATVRAMAANYGLGILYANWCGDEGDLTYCGGSVIIGPHGEVLASAGLAPALLITDLSAPDPQRLASQLQDFRAIRVRPD